MTVKKSCWASLSGSMCLFLGVLLLVTILSTCGPAMPQPTAPPTPAVTEPAPPAATHTPAPAPTATGATATSVEASVPLTTELKATVVAGLPPTPTPDPSAEGWGEIDVAILPLAVPAGSPPLWAAYSVGMGYYAPLPGHFVAIFAHDSTGWHELSSVVPLDCAEIVEPAALKQVQVEPGRIWLEMQSYAGVHSGCYNLLSFDGQRLRLEASNLSSSPGAGYLADLNGDGNQEVILNQTEDYVFCYACGVRWHMAQVLRWDGEQMAAVDLTPLAETAPADLRQLNDRAVALAQAELWQEAQATIAQATAYDIPDPELRSTVTWNAVVINLVAEARAEQARSGAYPLLENIFYGDYAAALAVMRPYPVEDIWGIGSPLVVGTVAEGWEPDLSAWISATTNLALRVQPDLAAAYFLRGWAAHLADPTNPAVLTDVRRAVELAPDDALFSQSLTYLAGPATSPLATTEQWKRHTLLGPQQSGRPHVLLRPGE